MKTIVASQIMKTLVHVFLKGNNSTCENPS